MFYKIPITFADETRRVVPNILLPTEVELSVFKLEKIPMLNGIVMFNININDQYNPYVDVRFNMGDWVDADKFFKENIKTDFNDTNDNRMYVGEFKSKLIQAINKYIQRINDANIDIPHCADSRVFVKDKWLYAPIYDCQYGKAEPVPEYSLTRFRIYEIGDIDFREIGWEI